VVGIADRLGIPVQYIGLGEGLEDLQLFDPRAFVDALFEEG
jgi:fused signal recognition particle receptor